MSTTEIDRPVVTGTEIVPADVLLPMSPDLAKRAMQEYHDISEATIDPDKDLQRIGSKKFVKKSGWLKLANWYHLSTPLVSSDVEREAGRPVRAYAVARATAPNGRYAEAGGSCSVEEDRFTNERGEPIGRTKLEHDLRATAETRATNRAIANLVGFGEVSAEEVDARAVDQEPAAPYGQLAGAAMLIRACEQLARATGTIGSVEEWLVPQLEANFHTEGMPLAAVKTMQAVAVMLTDGPSEGQEQLAGIDEEGPPPSGAENGSDAPDTAA